MNISCTITDTLTSLASQTISTQGASSATAASGGIVPERVISSAGFPQEVSKPGNQQVFPRSQLLDLVDPDPRVTQRDLLDYRIKSQVAALSQAGIGLDGEARPAGRHERQQ